MNPKFISDSKEYFREILIDNEDKYDNLKKHFSIGDTVFYIDDYSKIIKVIIDAIQIGVITFNSEEEFENIKIVKGDMIYYWIISEECKFKFINKLFNKLSFFIPKKLKYIKYRLPKCFPGHAVSAGDDIFKTEYDAKLYLAVSNAYWNISDYLDIDK